MAITVRTPAGERTFEDLGDLWRAVKAGDVAPHDEVRTAPDAPWGRVGDLPPPKRSLWQRMSPWRAVVDLMGAKRS